MRQRDAISLPVRCPFMGENTKWMLDDLAYLGITFDGETLYQSKRFPICEIYFNRLRDMGLLYPCYCSRAILVIFLAGCSVSYRSLQKVVCTTN